MKHDPTTVMPITFWNWSKLSLISNQVFIASYISWALRNEIKWLDVIKRQALASMVSSFSGCIGIIDGTLVKICRPWKNPNYSKWFNDHKKMYCMNNVVIGDHHGLSIYIDSSYPGSFHDVSYLRAL